MRNDGRDFAKAMQRLRRGPDEKRDCLLKGKKAENVRLVGVVNQREVSEITLLLLGLLGEDVTLVSVLSLDLS